MQSSCNLSIRQGRFNVSIQNKSYLCGDDKSQDPVFTKSNMSDELLKLKNQTVERREDIYSI